MNFKDFKDLIDCNARHLMVQVNVYKTNVDKDLLWDTYLHSYSLEEQQLHNCNTCRHFIKNVGGLVWLDEYLTVHTVWEDYVGLHTEYQKVSKALHELVLSSKIVSLFATTNQNKKFGNDFNHALVDGVSIKWNHFVSEVPSTHIRRDVELGEFIGRSSDKKNTLKRAFEEITQYAVTDILDLINEGQLYRGEQHKTILEAFLDLHKQYHALSETKQDLFCWSLVRMSDALCGIRNTSLGQLLLSVSTDGDLDKAVRAYEAMTAPSNYRRPAGTITSSKQLEKAQATIQSLGLEHSLERRYATADDIPVENSLYIHRTQKEVGDIFSLLKGDIQVKAKDYKDLPIVSVDELFKEIQAGGSNLEIYLDNKVINNLVTLTTGEYSDSSSLFSWNNQVGWSYKDALADSDIKRKVKEAGGNVQGKLRNSLAWYNTDDLDLHLSPPDYNEIYFGAQQHRYGQLDVDANFTTIRRDPVENIVFATTVPNGSYKLWVHNYTKRESVDVGFQVEIEFMGEVYTFVYSHPVKQSETIVVAEYEIKGDTITFIDGLTPTVESVGSGRKVWGLPVNDFHIVDVACLSPNYWGYNQGNKHYFFFLKDCIPDEAVRPLFNEFLKPELIKEHKQVFEVLGSRIQLKGKPSLGGLGFSVGSKGVFTCRLQTTQGQKLFNVSI